MSEGPSADERSLLDIAGILDDEEAATLRGVIEERRKRTNLFPDKE